MYLFKNNQGNWVFGATPESVSPAGAYRLMPSTNDTKVSLRCIYTDDATIHEKLVTEFHKANGDHYASFEEFFAACEGFFAKPQESVKVEPGDDPLAVTVENEAAIPVTLGDEKVKVADDAGMPTALDIPDEVDTTDGTVIYRGYVRGESYLVLRTSIDGALISNAWAEGDWADREDLFDPIS